MHWWWQDELDAEGIDALIHSQYQIVSRPQLLAAEWTQTEIRRRLRRRWQIVHPGVYATHTGPVGYHARILAGLLYAGPEASWSHYTAEQLGLIRLDEQRPVHLTIPARRFHLRPERRWKDLARDIRATLRFEATLRYGWNDIQSRLRSSRPSPRRTPPNLPTLPATPCTHRCPVR
jgi:hypothetical protein